MRPFRCPVCGGTGLVSRPPWLPADQQFEWADASTTAYSCKVCCGTGLVWELKERER